MLKWMFAIPNGGQRSAAQGAKMKATGTKAGVWDIFLPVPVWVPPENVGERGNYLCGLFIEMKKPKDIGVQAGRLAKKQLQFQKHCQIMGYAEVVCYTWREAWTNIEGYLSFCTPEQIENYRSQMLALKTQ